MLPPLCYTYFCLLVLNFQAKQRITRADSPNRNVIAKTSIEMMTTEVTIERLIKEEYKRTMILNASTAQ